MFTPPPLGVEVGKPTHFTVNAKAGGRAPLDVQVVGAGKGDAVRDLEVLDHHDGTHTVKYTPLQPVRGGGPQKYTHTHTPGVGGTPKYPPGAGSTLKSTPGLGVGDGQLEIYPHGVGLGGAPRNIPPLMWGHPKNIHTHPGGGTPK